MLSSRAVPFSGTQVSKNGLCSSRSCLPHKPQLLQSKCAWTPRWEERNWKDTVVSTARAEDIVNICPAGTSLPSPCAMAGPQVCPVLMQERGPCSPDWLILPLVSCQHPHPYWPCVAYSMNTLKEGASCL